jgi:hypothetical protein
MSNAAESHSHEIHVYPSDLHEQPGGAIPLFLKLTYLGFTIFGVLYFALYFSGDGSPLVQTFNALTK